jgi:hypothetical protein
MTDDLVQRLRRKAQLMPVTGGGSASSDGKHTSYIRDDGMRLVNPDGPEAADRIERHEAFKQEVSDTLQEYIECFSPPSWHRIDQFIIPKPDPLVDVAESLGYFNTAAIGWAGDVRAALEARGLEIREKGQ